MLWRQRHLDTRLLSERNERIRPGISCTLLFLPRRMKVQSELANWFGTVYENLDILLTTNFSTNGIIMVIHGLGRLLCISGSLPYMDKTHIAARSLNPFLQVTAVLAWKRGTVHSEATERFIRLIREQSQS